MKESIILQIKIYNSQRRFMIGACLKSLLQIHVFRTFHNNCVPFYKNRAIQFTKRHYNASMLTNLKGLKM